MLAGAALVFGASWGVLHTGAFARFQITDVGLYRTYGDAVVAGRIPYHDFGLGYPPFALPVFIVPSLFSAVEYRHVFELLMLQCGVATIGFMALTARQVGAGVMRLATAAGFAAVAPLALGSVVLSRYDLWPAMLTAAALAALVDRRDRLGCFALALATAAKAYSVVLLPLALLEVARRRGRREALVAGGVFVVALAALTLPFAFGANGLTHTGSRQASRPLQLESLGSSVLLAANAVGAYRATVVNGPGSQNLSGALPDSLGTVATAMQVVAVVFVWFLFARGPRTRERLLLASAAAVTAFVAFGRVLSPQYLVWLIPLVPLIRGRVGLQASAILASALVLTQIWFPTRYFEVVHLHGIVWVVLARNLVLVALFTLLAAALRRPAEG